MSKATDSSSNPSKNSSKRYYWLGHEGESAQDRFFIEALDSTMWERGSREQWDTCWYTGMPDSEVFEQLDAQKSINHIPGNNALTIKSHLYETLMAAKGHAIGTANEPRYQFFPDTYSMPEDYYRFQADAAAEPDTLWIQKPKNLSRGRGIEVVQHPETVPFDSDWLIQRYIKEPHLYDGHKYVLRFYVLITSIEPLRFYLYHEGFAKLASEKYDDKELDNLYRHLTNPDINEENNNVEVPVTFFSFARYRQWLKDCGHDDEKLFKEFKDLIALTVIAARERMRHQLEKKESDRRGCYELIGLDCMVDKNIKPWILECNLSPSLETYASGDTEASDEFTVKRQLVHDLVDMMQLNAPVPDYSPEAKAKIEYQNRGGFIPLITQDNANDYLSCFPVPRASDIFVLGELPIDYKKIPTQIHVANEVIFDDSLAIQVKNNDSIQFLTPNELATWVWLKNNEGLTPPEIAAALCETMPIPADTDKQTLEQTLLKQVWDTLADWGQAGAFDKPSLNQINKFYEQPLAALYCQFNNDVLTINLTCPVALAYLTPLLEVNMPEEGNAIDKAISIYPAKYGYTLILGSQIIEEKIKLAELMPAILNAYFKEVSQSYHFSASVIAVKQEVVLLVAKTPLDSLELISKLGSTVEVLSDFPCLAETQGTINTGRFPLLKPHQYVSGKKPSIVAQAAKMTHKLEKNIRDNQALMLDAMVFVENDESENALDASSQAKALSLLWPCFFRRDQLVAQTLTAWMSELPFLSYNLANDSDFVESISELLVTHKTADCA